MFHPIQRLFLAVFEYSFVIGENFLLSAACHALEIGVREVDYGASVADGRTNLA